MISSAELLSAFESCARRGFWSRQWQRHRMSVMEMLNASVREALVEDTGDPGEFAGETFMGFARDRGLERGHRNLYETALHHSAIADIITFAIRQNGERWIVPLEEPEGWTTSALMSPDGSHLRRFLAVSNWNEARELYERSSWFCLGEMAAWRMPMRLVVAAIGPMVSGKRHSPWAKGMVRPSGADLRFKRRARFSGEDFKITWAKVFREERNDIPREKWFQTMLDDDVVAESLAVVNIPVLKESQASQIRELAKMQLDRMDRISWLPPKQLSSCFSPLNPCPFQGCCWGHPESTPKENSGIFDSHRPAPR